MVFQTAVPVSVEEDAAEVIICNCKHNDEWQSTLFSNVHACFNAQVKGVSVPPSISVY